VIPPQNSSERAYSNLIVYGRVKKFRNKPKGPRGKTRMFSKAPEYYIELQHIEITQPTQRGGRNKNSRPNKRVEGAVHWLLVSGFWFLVAGCWLMVAG